MTATETSHDKPTAAERRVAAFRADLTQMAEAARAALAEPQRYERLLRQPEAAAYLGVAEKTLWYWRRWKCGPAYYRIGSTHVGYTIPDLDAFRERMRVEPKYTRKSTNEA